MTQTVRDAKQQENEGALAVIEQHRRDLADVLPSHISTGTWMRVAMGAVRKSTDLWKACNETPGSMMNALMEAARLGLEPGTEEYYLTPRRNKSGKWEVLGIVGYQGEIELIYRAGAVSSVICYDVREGDHFQWRPGIMDRPAHEPKQGAHAWFSGRGKVLGCYAYAIMRDTGAVSEVVIVDDERIKRAMDASGTASASHSPWQSDYRAMVLKTGAHDLSKWVPTSAEYRREQLRASASVAAEITGGQRQPAQQAPQAREPGGFVPPPPGSDVIDGELVDEPTGQRPAATSGQPAPTERPAKPVSKSRMNRLFALLADAGVTTTEKRHRLATHVLDKDVNSFAELSAAEVDDLIKRLEQLKAEGKFPAAAPPPDDTPAEQPEAQPTADTGGDQQ